MMPTRLPKIGLYFQAHAKEQINFRGQCQKLQKNNKYQKRISLASEGSCPKTWRFGAPFSEQSTNPSNWWSPKKIFSMCRKLGGDAFGSLKQKARSLVPSAVATRAYYTYKIYARKLSCIRSSFMLKKLQSRKVYQVCLFPNLAGHLFIHIRPW